MTEERKSKEMNLGEKGVYRRRLGILGFVAGVAAFIAGGFAWFDIDVGELWAILGSSGGLIGIGVFKDVSKNKYSNGNGY